MPIAGKLRIVVPVVSAKFEIENFKNEENLNQFVNKIGQPLPGAKQFRRNKFSTSAESSSFSSSRSNRDVISFRSNMGTNGPTDGWTNIV
jgi:hypothetical protein